MTLLEQTRAFVNHPQNRTTDVVPSLKILCTQLFAWSKLSDEDKQVEADPQNADQQEDLEEADFKKLTWFIAEETSRRNLKRDAKPLERSQILSMLMPDYEKIVLTYKKDVKANIEKKLSGKSEDDSFAHLKVIADKLRAIAQKGKEKKQEDG